MSRLDKLPTEAEEQPWFRRIARASAVNDVARRMAWSSMAVAAAILGVRELAPELWANVTAWLASFR